MGFKVILAPRAIEDLRAIVLYVAADRPQAAERLGHALIEKTKILGSFPLLGQKVPEFGDAAIRELVLKPFRIIYRVDEGRHVVGVARFWHGTRGQLEASDLVELA